MALNEVDVRVAVRCRPLIGMGEQLEGPAEFIQCLKMQKQVVVDEKAFTFDYIFDSTDGQESIYDTSVTPIMEKFLLGSNAAVIAYGQTGSGKTFTMGTTEQYTISEADSTATDNVLDVGIIPRVLKHIFEHVANRALHKESDSLNGLAEDLPIITVSFLEVYNEEVYDILSPSRLKIPIRENAHVVKLSSLKEIKVTSYNEAMKCLSDGAQIRTTGATATNAHSSRSHAIFSVQLEQITGGDHVQNRIMLVDLAGSEAVKKTKTQGSRFKEGVNINRGLLALGNVIRALSKDKGRSYVPYRDSTLSRLLQASLQGNSNTLIIACINQVENNFLETTSTLQFATNARAVKIKLLAGDRDNGTPCGWKRPYSSRFITPTTVGRSHLYNKSATKMPMNSTMLSSTAIKEIRNHDKDLSTGRQSMPSMVQTELQFSPLPTLDESLVEPVFKKPRTPPLTVSRPAAGFSPYVERICSNFEKCIGKLLANRPSPRFDTPSRNSPMNSAVQQTQHILQDCTNATHRTSKHSEQSIFGTLEDTVIDASPKLRNKIGKMEIMSSLSETSVKKSRIRTASIPSRRSIRHQTMAVENNSIQRLSSLQQSIVMSPRRTMEGHTAEILNVLNHASVKQLQLLPHIGPKSALIVYNWRTHNGPFKDVIDLKSIPGLPQSFMKQFAAKNLIGDLEDSLVL